MSTQGKTESDDTSFAASSPRRPLYFVQSPSRDSHDGEKTSISFHSTPALSPMGSPPHSNSNSSVGRHSSSTRFSGKISANGGHHRKGEKSWKEFDKIEEEGLLEVDGAQRGISPRCYIIAFVVGFFLLFSLFSLILWCVSKSQKPTILMQSIRFQQFSIQAGVDSSGVPTQMVSMTTIVKFKFRNTATFFGLHVTATPLNISFNRLTLATGIMQKFYQPRNSHKTMKVILRGTHIPLYGGGASLSSSEGSVTGRVPLTLSFTVRSRGYVLGKLVKPKFYLKVKCPVDMDFGYTKKKFSIPLKNSCTYHR